MRTDKSNTLNSWLKGVSNELTVRRIELVGLPKPKRNRERERARREARQLFAAYELEQGLETKH